MAGASILVLSSLNLQLIFSLPDPASCDLLPSRGYGGVAIIWRENIDHLIKILPDGTERIQCVEINSNNDTNFLVASVYLPSKGSHDCR